MTARRMGRGPALGYVSAVAALFLTGCDALDSPDAQYGAVCVDQATGNRLDDDACGDWDDTGHATAVGTYYVWVPTSNGATVIPPVGGRVPANVGIRSVPSGAPVAKGLPKAGGTMSAIQRGGFGVKAGVSGGTGAKAGGSAGS
ncbi:hypothetical protein [Amycolatopsis thermoflava]|uniref:hypothetical protein n=1 Tax=Amycolatopsis thermoflava TaxID=84480 RepID=UPI000404B93E|nr:hypothetical protein [Amycolatopsis thermoflava]